MFSIYITFSKIFSNRKIAFLFDGYHVEKQTKNFFKVARNLASLECTLSTKGESEGQPVGNSDKYNLSAKGGNSHAKIAYTSAVHGLHIGKAKIRQTTATKNEKRIRTSAFLFRQQDCVFHSRQSNLKGVKNAIELFEKRKDNRP